MVGTATRGRLVPRDPDGDRRAAAVVGGIGRVQLRWSPWRHQVVVRSGRVLGVRRTDTAAAPLEVRTPPGWAVSAGTGSHADEIDVNDGWCVDGVRGTLLLLSELRPTVAALLRRA